MNCNLLTFTNLLSHLQVASTGHTLSLLLGNTIMVLSSKGACRKAVELVNPLSMLATATDL